MDDIYIEAKLNEGKQLARDGNAHDAIEYFIPVITASEISHIGHYYTGLQFFSLGIFEDALEHFEMALKHRPDYAEALDRMCVTLYLLKRNKEGCECLKIAGHEPGDHHYIHQFIGLKEAGYEDLILPDFESDPNAKIMPDTSICLEFLGVGSRFHTPQLQRFIEKHIGRLIVTRTVMSEVHSVLEKKDRRNDPAIQERLGMLEAAVVDIKADAKTVAKLGRLLLGIIARRGRACWALWLAKGRKKARIGQNYDKIILPDNDKLVDVLYKGSASDRKIMAETVTASASLSCMVYLVTSDFDMSIIAVHIYRISKGMVLPVRPEQIMWNM